MMAAKIKNGQKDQTKHDRGLLEIVIVCEEIRQLKTNRTDKVKDVRLRHISIDKMSMRIGH